MKTFIFALPILVLMSVCVTQHQKAAAKTRYRPLVVVTESQKKIIHAEVRSGLANPASAQFGNMIAYDNGSILAVCGIVSAKNRRNGFTGIPYYGFFISRSGSS